ncbi:MAG TPA: hypothetical protein VKA40_00145 [Nitrososphaera sp.]|nr:hypothetical protein [Nitrososphaera sp.]
MFTINTANITFMFKDDDIEDTIIDASQSLISMTDWSVILIKYGFYFA